MRFELELVPGEHDLHLQFNCIKDNLLPLSKSIADQGKPEEEKDGLFLPNIIEVARAHLK